MIVAGDGNAYLPYYYEMTGASGSGVTTTHTVCHLMVVRVSPDGSYNKMELGTGSVDTTTSSDGSCTTSNGTDFSLIWWSTDSIITNADQGAAVVATALSYTPTSCGFSEQAQLQISYVSKDSITSQVTSANPGLVAFLPVLQREDGSFVGLDEWGDVFAVGLDGTELWSAGALGTPLYATADGGVIVTSTLCAMPVHWNGPCPYPLGTLYTLDQNGDTTSQTPDTGTKYSWKGAYATGGDPQVRLILAAMPNLLPTYAAVFGGNLTGNGANVVHTTIGLFWCGSTFSGPCIALQNDLGEPQQTYLIDLGFDYALNPIPFDNQSGYPSGIVYDLTPNRAWDGIILSQAFAALQKAFAPFPAIIVETATPPNTQNFDFIQGLSVIPDYPSEQHLVYVCANFKHEANKPSTLTGGSTNSGYSPSIMYYGSVLIGAQQKLGLTQLPTADPSLGMTPGQASAFLSLLKGVGIAIGNLAAHEVGHQFALPLMDCDAPGGPACTGNVSHQYLYEYYSATAADYSYVGPPLTWTAEDTAALTHKLLNK
jgi:hypothetical protein